MTVADLINELAKVPGDYVVHVMDYNDLHGWVPEVATETYIYPELKVVEIV